MPDIRRHLQIAVALPLVAPCAHGQVKMTTEKALKLAFPKCAVERRTITLTEKQRLALGKLTGRKFTKSMAFAYIARRGKTLVGTAWFDVHKVRSKKQLLMVVVTPRLTVDRVEVLAFAEPKRYAAPKKWVGKLAKKRLGQVRPGKDVPRITGATLTVRAMTRCVDRILALHQTVFGKPTAKEPSKKDPKPKNKGKAKTQAKGAKR